jgi:hypothetical protein
VPKVGKPKTKYKVRGTGKQSFHALSNGDEEGKPPCSPEKGMEFS